MISLGVVDECNLDLNQITNVSLVWGSGATSHSLGMVEVEFEISSTKRTWQFYVADAPGLVAPVILGLDWVENEDLQICWGTKIMILRESDGILVQMIPRQDGDGLTNGLPRSDPRPPSDDETDLEYRVLGLQIWETPEWEESSLPESEDQGTLDSTLLRGGNSPPNEQETIEVEMTTNHPTSCKSQEGLSNLEEPEQGDQKSKKSLIVEERIEAETRPLVKKFLAEYKYLFAELPLEAPGHIEPHRIKLKPESRPSHVPTYRSSPKQVEVLAKQVEEYLDRG